METDMKSLAFTPVGIVRNAISTPFLKADENGISATGRAGEIKQHLRNLTRSESRIIINPAQAGLLHGIDAYSHLVVLYWAHKVPLENRSATQVRPMGRKDMPKVGIFCTSSPLRPNPVLTTVVRLLNHQDNILTVTGLDAVDQSPVIDIKPYVRAFYPDGETEAPAWMNRIMAEINS
ncbi:MAG: SAM-dependent methyltransferase [Desulfobacter sp.]